MSDNFDKDFWDAVVSLDPSFKVEAIRVNISSSFMARARCKFCRSGPDYYYGSFKPHMWSDVSRYRSFTKRNKKWIRRMCSSWYKQFEPRTFEDISEFTFRLDYQDMRPTLFRTRGTSTGERENVMECLGCKCGRTIWGFNQRSVKKRPEITNRKGKYGYPKKFVQ